MATSVLIVLASVLVGCRVSDASYVTYVTCYDCYTVASTGKVSSNCNDPFNENVIPTCVGSTCTKYYSDCRLTPELCQPSQVRIVVRGCSNSSILNDNCGTTSYSKGKAVSCVCNSDKCNEAQVMRLSNKMAVALIVIVLSTIFN